MKVYSIEKHGLPDMSNLVGKVAFIFDGCIVSGGPLRGEEDYENAPDDLWEGNSDVSFGKFSGVKYYVVFDTEVWNINENYNNEK